MVNLSLSLLTFSSSKSSQAPMVRHLSDRDVYRRFFRWQHTGDLDKRAQQDQRITYFVFVLPIWVLLTNMLASESKYRRSIFFVFTSLQILVGASPLRDVATILTNQLECGSIKKMVAICRLKTFQISVTCDIFTNAVVFVQAV